MTRKPRGLRDSLRRSAYVLSGTLGLMFTVQCGIGGSLLKSASIYFSTETPNNVASTFDQYCVTCHKPGGIGPFALQTYDQIFSRRAQISAAMDSRVMPPWGAEADPSCPTIQNSHWIPQQEIERVKFWVAAGAPQGPPSAPLLGRGSGFTIDQPDFEARAVVPHTPVFPNGQDTYPCILVRTDLATDTYLDELAFVPSNTQIAHHSIVMRMVDQNGPFAQMFDSAYDLGLDSIDCGAVPEMANLAVWETFHLWSAGGQKLDFSRYNAKPLLRSGRQRFVFQMHYSGTTGGSGPDRPALLFKKAPPVAPGTYAPVVLGGFIANMPGAFEVPANSPHFQVYGSYYSTIGGRRMVLGILPHMHQYGKEFRAWVVRASGTVECLVVVPKYNFNWQWTYMFSVPVILGPTDTMVAQFVWSNKTNQVVTFGEGSNQEMGFGFTLEASLPDL